MLRYMLPLLLFMVMAVFLALGLRLNPSDLPSPLINKPAPDFSLPTLANPNQTISNHDFLGEVWLLNVWASWCASCRVEHPLLNQLAQKNLVTMVGLNYKDEPRAARQWLSQLGNPYTVSLIDQEGRTGIDYGVYGVPETYIIGKKGLIRYKHLGPVSLKDIQNLLPFISQLKSEI